MVVLSLVVEQVCCSSILVVGAVLATTEVVVAVQEIPMATGVVEDLHRIH